MSRRIEPHLPTRHPVLAAAFGLLVVAFGCTTSQVFRLNPGETPERYRIVCRDSSRFCERQAREVCDGEFSTLSKQASEPELEEVKDTDVSSSGPSQGLVNWRGEMVVMCGRELPPLHLVRTEPAEAAPANTAASSASAEPTEPRVERVCIPGETQACLGPGACSGAQACLLDGSAFGVCDCGTNVPPAPTSSAPPVSSAGN